MGLRGTHKSDELAALDHAIWSVEVYLDEFAQDALDTQKTQAELTDLYAMRKALVQPKGQGGKNGTQG